MYSEILKNINFDASIKYYMFICFGFDCIGSYICLRDFKKSFPLAAELTVIFTFFEVAVKYIKN